MSPASPPDSLAPLLIVAAVREEVRSLLPREPPRSRGTVASAVSARLHAEESRTKPRVEEDAARARVGWPIISINPGVSVVLSGVGRANAAGATVQALTLRRYAAVFNVGVAGALHGSGLSIGDVVLATQSVFAEEGIDLPEGPADMSALAFPLAHESWCEGNRILPDASLIELCGDSIGQGVERGAVATVARCSGTDRAAAAVAAQTGARAEAMEGAAVLLAAHRMGVHRCAEVRVISNTCGDRLHQHWDLSAAFNRIDLMLKHLVELAR